MSNFENAKVKVEQGWLQGYVEGRNKIFKGIPFAKPPVGELRFKHPEFPIMHSWTLNIFEVSVLFF